MHYVELLALYMRLPAFNYRIIALSIIAAIAMLIALLALAPSLAQGATRDVAEVWRCRPPPLRDNRKCPGISPLPPGNPVAGRSAPVARQP